MELKLLLMTHYGIDVIFQNYEEKGNLSYHFMYEDFWKRNIKYEGLRSMVSIQKRPFSEDPNTPEFSSVCTICLIT